MIEALIKRVSVTYKCYEMYAHRGKKVCNCSCFEIDQETNAILLIIALFTEFAESSSNQSNNALISYFL